MQQQIRALVDDSSQGYMVALVNVSGSKKSLLCGFASFRGGLTGAMVLSDVDRPESKFTIVVPPSVKDVATSVVYSSIDDSYEVQLDAIET